MSEKPLQPQDKYVLRLPDGLRDRLKAAAQANGRSLNSEIISRIERVISPDADGWVRFYLPPDLIRRIEEAAREHETTPEIEIRSALEDAFPYAPRLIDLFQHMNQDILLAGDDADPALKSLVEDALAKFRKHPELASMPLQVPDVGYELGPDEE